MWILLLWITFQSFSLQHDFDTFEVRAKLTHAEDTVILQERMIGRVFVKDTFAMIENEDPHAIIGRSYQTYHLKKVEPRVIEDTLILKTVAYFIDPPPQIRDSVIMEFHALIGPENLRAFRTVVYEELVIISFYQSNP